MYKNKYKEGDEVVVLCVISCVSDKPCRNQIGKVKRTRDVMADSHRGYLVGFKKKIDCSWAKDACNTCWFSEKEICLNIKEEVERYHLYRFANV